MVGVDVSEAPLPGIDLKGAKLASRESSFFGYPRWKLRWIVVRVRGPDICEYTARRFTEGRFAEC
jgi:hypothetical protein